LKVPVHLYHSSKGRSHKEVTKQEKSRFFYLLLLDDKRIRIHVDPDGPKTYGSYGSGTGTLPIMNKAGLCRKRSFALLSEMWVQRKLTRVLYQIYRGPEFVKRLC
jgi:hypothetical protein